MSAIPAALILAAEEVEKGIVQAGFRFCFIGGLAVQRWGEQRYTRDIDLTLLCNFGEETVVAGRLARIMTSRLPNAIEFATESRVFLGQASNGIPVDVALGALEFEDRCVARASGFDYGGGILLTTCGAEDLIVMKAFAGRSQDWADIEGIILRRGSAIDWPLIERELSPLLAVKESDDTLERLSRLRKSAGRGSTTGAP